MNPRDHGRSSFPLSDFTVALAASPFVSHLVA
jgi:hypothetical protein